MADSEDKEPTGRTPPPPAVGSVGPMGSMDESPTASPAPVDEPAQFQKQVGPMGSIEDVEVATTETPALSLDIPQPVAAPPELVELAITPTIESTQIQERQELLPPVAMHSDAPPPEEPSYPPTIPAAEQRSSWMRWPVALVLLGFVFMAVRYQGWDLRKSVYLHAHGLHWGDVSNAYTIYGTGARATGLFKTYDVARSNVEGAMHALDYPPLRLAVIYAWRGWGERAEREEPDAKMAAPGSGEDSYVLTEPMLRLNMACEIVSAILVFILIWVWTIRQRDPSDPNPGWFWPVIGFAVCEGIAATFFGVNSRQADVPTLIFFYLGAICLAQMIPSIAAAFAGALLFWFNPAVIWNAYAWPQWDVWLFPFLLGAILLASTEWWFGAGMLIAIGAMLKGQLLMVSPLFLLWPLLRLRWMPAVRFLGGFLLTFAAIAFAWMLPDTHARVWIGLFGLAMLLLVPFVLRVKMNKGWTGALAAAAILAAWPWGTSASLGVRFCTIGVLGLVSLAHFLPRRLVPSIYAIGLGIAIFLMIPLYDASNAWYTQGYKFGAEKFMEIGTTVSGAGGTSYTNNLPVLFQRLFNWPNNPETAMVDVTWLRSIGLGWLGFTQVSARGFMLTIYGVCLLLCAIGAAIHSRRGDARFLACMVAPWLCSFVLLTQLNNRYLVWGAGMCALLPAVGVGMSLLGIIVSLICWIGMAQLQYTRFPVDPGMTRLIDPLSPDVGWMLALAAAVCLYVAIVPGSRRRARTPLPMGLDHEPLSTGGP